MSGTSLTVAEKAHATLGASTASRWMTCPGSVRLSEGIPNTSSEFAREGTTAHALAELAFRRHTDPHSFVGTTVEGIEVTEEMADYVGVYVDYVDAEWAKCEEEDSLAVCEQKFNLAALNPPSPMFGTADYVIYDAGTNTLHVIDLKYGQGVVVEAVGNKQLRYYALGAFLSPSFAGLDIDSVQMTIVQPRVLHPDGFIRTDFITPNELVGFAGDLLDAAKRTTDPDAPLVTGPHCRFCPAAAICPARLSEAQAVAQMDFADLPVSRPPEPESLPPEVFADVLAHLHILEDWASAMRSHAKAKLERGEEVPGFKLVQKRATRKWTSPEHVTQYMAAAGFERDEYLDEKPKSPAQLEKLFAKKKMPEELEVVKISSGVTMVPNSDPRPAASLSAGEEFTAIGSGE